MDGPGYAFLRGLTFKPAGESERAAAFELRRLVYEDDLGHVPADEFDAEAHHLVACDEQGAVVAAVRLVGPEQRPFDLERAVDLSTFLRPGSTPALIGRLCVRHDHRTVRKGSFLQLGMLKLACAYARRRQWTDFVLYTYPYLVPFYRGGFFELVDVTFDHPDWGKVHVMHLDLLGLESRQKKANTPVARLLFGPELPNFQV